MAFNLKSLVAVAIAAGFAFGKSTNDTTNFINSCETIGHSLGIANATLQYTEYVPAGTNISSVGMPDVCPGPDGPVVVDLCRLYMTISTAKTSGLRSELWLPRDYNGRFLSTGNGGLNGCIRYDDLVFGTRLGFATVGTNNGHDGDTAVYFQNNTEVLKDYIYRSVYTGSVVGKQVTRQFYDEGFAKSYYVGCSGGGRQGLKLVQDYPEEFDGVLAGALGVNAVNLFSWGARAFYITGLNTSDNFVTANQWTKVYNETLKQCDLLDGAEDGIIDNPDACQPDFKTLLCTNNNDSDCLTSAQLKIVDSALSGLYAPDGTLLYPGWNPGSELEATRIYFSGSMFPYSREWYEYVVFKNSSWDPRSWTPDDALVALDQDTLNFQTAKTDLSEFQSNGGKLIAYHGTIDPVINSANSKWYYDQVATKMNSTHDEMDAFFRLFLISGMSHCEGGTGASYIGAFPGSYLATEPENNLLMKLVDWVENGNAPEVVRGAKLADDGETVEYYRKHCRYPRRNAFVGPGNYTDEDSWRCVLNQ